MVDDIVDECFSGDGLDAQLLMVLSDVVANAVEKVRFAEPYPAVDEEGIVRFAGPCGDADSSRFDKGVGRALNKIIESVKVVELELVGGGRLLSHFRLGLGQRG